MLFPLLLLSVISQCALASDEILRIDPAQTRIDLASASFLLEDPDGKLTLADVQRPENARRFQHRLPHIGFTASTWWFRFKLSSGSPKPVTWWFDSGNRTLQEIALYAPDPSGVYQRQVASSNLPFAERPLNTADYIFPVSIGHESEIFLRVRSTGFLGVIVVPQLWEPETCRALQEAQTAQWLFYLGITTSLGLFHLMLCISVKDTNYLRYVFASLASVWAMSSATGGFGSAYAFFWPNSPIFEQTGWVASILAASCGPILFLFKFLNFSHNVPRLHAFLKLCLCGLAVLVGGQILGTLYGATSGPTSGPTVPNTTHLLQGMYLFSMMIFIAMYSGAIFSICLLAWRGNRQAKFLCVAWLPVLSFGTLWSIHSFLGYKFNIALTMWASAGEQILISLALADRFNQERKAKGLAQVAMTEVLRKSGDELEGKVAMRTKELEQEQSRARQLLHSVLPADVATELSETGSSEPARHDSVSILFTDFMGFAKAVSDMPADQMVTELNDIFAAFDDIADACGVEKIKSIGDAYMAAAGLPKPCADHAQRCVRAGLMMVDYLNRRNENTEFKWHLRVGIHSGPVVAGVVGKRKFAYDIWGDTVNVAARIESAGDIGRVNISAYTCHLVQNEFECQYRGKLDAKGKGPIDMYFVTKTLPS